MILLLGVVHWPWWPLVHQAWWGQRSIVGRHCLRWGAQSGCVWVGNSPPQHSSPLDEGCPNCGGELDDATVDSPLQSSHPWEQSVPWLEGRPCFSGRLVGLPLIQPPLGPVRVSWLEGWPCFRGGFVHNFKSLSTEISLSEYSLCSHDDQQGSTPPSLTTHWGNESRQVIPTLSVTFHKQWTNPATPWDQSECPDLEEWPHFWGSKFSTLLSKPVFVREEEESAVSGVPAGGQNVVVLVQSSLSSVPELQVHQDHLVWRRKLKRYNHEYSLQS